MILATAKRFYNTGLRGSFENLLKISFLIFALAAAAGRRRAICQD